MKNKSSDPYIVKYAAFQTTRLVDHVNEYHGDIKTSDAKRMAQDNNLDLVCFNQPEKDVLAFCKIIDYGKWKYSVEKAKKKQSKGHKKETKEVRFSPVISENDISHKLKHVKEFLEEGHEVVFSMRLKGRQRQHFDQAEQRMNEIIDLVKDIGKEVSRKKNPSLITVRIGQA